MPLKFLQETFDCLDLPNLLIDIWSYAEHLYHNPSLAPPPSPPTPPHPPAADASVKYTLNFVLMQPKKNGQINMSILILWFII